jgi:hypothetical protein
VALLPVVAPFGLGFSDHTDALVLYLVIGAGGLVVTLLTRFESDLEPARQPATMRSPA